MGCIEEDDEKEKDELKDTNNDKIIDLDLNVISDTNHNLDKTSHHVAHPNEQTQFLLLLQNTGNITETFQMQTIDPGTGWKCILNGVEGNMDNNKLQIIPGGSEALILTVKVPASGTVTFQIIAQSLENSAIYSSVEVSVKVKDLGNVTSKMGSNVNVYYTLIDRGTDDEFDENVWRFNQAGEYPFTIGDGTIQGFINISLGMREGETRVWLLPEEDCYGSDPEDWKPDGPLIFEVTMLDLDYVH
jgi:hypothetical protein